jgi:hypothetical protein
MNTTSGYELSLVGASGKLRLTDPSVSRWIQFAWQKLEEVDPDGIVVQRVNNFASLDIEWTTPQVEVVNGFHGISSTIEGEISIGNQGQAAPTAMFSLSVFTFDEQATIVTGDTSVIVPSGSVKFNIECVGWPFESMNNRLQFGVALSSHRVGGTNSQQNETSVDGIFDSSFLTARAKVVRYGNGAIVNPPLAIIDGVEKNITTTVAQNILTWSFPAFAETLLYDPVIGLETVTSSAVAIKSSAISIVFLIVVVVTMLC